MLTAAKKHTIVSEFTETLKQATSIVFVNFHGLSVAKSTKLRRELRKVQAGYRVVKKTLLKRALDAVDISDSPKLEGEVGVVFGAKDATELPRIVAQFIKAEKEGLKILGGVYESKFVGSDIINRLASIPPRDTLLTQLAFILTQSMANFARALTEVAKKVESKI